MSDDIFVDFTKDIFDFAGKAIGLGGIEITLGKLAIEALSKDWDENTSEQDKLKKYEILKKIDKSEKEKVPVPLTKEEVPILRKAINRTVDILTFGRVHDILEAAPTEPHK